MLSIRRCTNYTLLLAVGNSFLSLALASQFALAVSSVAAQRLAFSQPQPAWGGRLVHEMLPHHPGSPCVEPRLDPTPIYLQQSPEFCQSADPYATDAYSSQPILLRQPTPSAASQLPPGVRSGIFQKLFFTGTYLPQIDDDSLGLSELETGIVLGFPFFRVTTPLLVTPRFAVHYLDRPAAPDLPPRVYDAEVSFRHLRKFGDGPWAMNAAVTLGYYSDFESSDADALRVTGQALAVYEASPAAKWIFGVVYLNRQDVSIVPAVGVIYRPTPEVIYEAILPRPRIAWRLPGGTIGAGNQRWAYIAGEFGGGIWSIERPATLTRDLLTYTDFRVLVGLERKITGGLSHRLEAGYVFGRELQFASTTPDVRLDDSLFLRAAFTY